MLSSPCKTRAGCFGKVGYAHRADADKARAAFRKRKDSKTDRMNTYCCRYCGLFHIGRERGSPQLRRTPDHERQSMKNRKARYTELTK
jgi:hypothetical protein